MSDFFEFSGHNKKKGAGSHPVGNSADTGKSSQNGTTGITAVRLFILILTAVIFTVFPGLLLSCGRGIDLGPDTSTRQKQQLVIAHNQSRKVLVESINDSAQRFMADNPDYEITTELYINEAYKKKLASAAATGNLPDIFATWSGGTLNEFAELDMIINLKDLMIRHKDYDRFLTDALAQVTDAEGVWAVPVENIALALVFYNTEIFDKYQLAPPATWNELLTIVRRLKEEDIIPFALANRSGWTGSMYYMYLVDRQGGPSLFSGALNRTLPEGFAAPEFVKAWEYFRQLNDLGAFPTNANTLDEDVGDSKQLMYDERAAMTINGSWLFSDVYDEHPDFLEKLDFFTFPALPDGQGDPSNLVGTVGDQFYSISASCDNPQKAYEFIRYLIDDTAVKQRLDAYVIPPLKDINTDNLMLQRISELAANAPSIQFWYDQSLSPKLAEEHKQICRDMLNGLQPDQAAEIMEQAARQYEVVN